MKKIKAFRLGSRQIENNTPQSIRIILIEGNDVEAISLTMQQIREDDILADLGIISVKLKGHQIITIKCIDEENAEKMRKTLLQKLRESRRSEQNKYETGQELK